MTQYGHTGVSAGGSRGLDSSGWDRFCWTLPWRQQEHLQGPLYRRSLVTGMLDKAETRDPFPPELHSRDDLRTLPVTMLIHSWEAKPGNKSRVPQGKFNRMWVIYPESGSLECFSANVFLKIYLFIIYK